MALNRYPATGRAVALFDPTASGRGFAQPLLIGQGGDNRCFVQSFVNPERVSGLLDVAWPEKDIVNLDQELAVEVGDESLWAFLTPGQAPIVAFWSRFREKMLEHLAAPELEAHPLLQFDIVDTLGLERAKREVYARAYHAYAKISEAAADNWRDRSILEPALHDAIVAAQGDRDQDALGNDGSTPGKALPGFRARIGSRGVEVRLRDTVTLPRNVLEDAYSDLTKRFPELFRGKVKVSIDVPRQVAPTKEQRARKITIVTIGRLAEHGFEQQLWGVGTVELTDLSRIVSNPPSPETLVLVVGAQSDWGHLLDAAEKIVSTDCMVVVLTSTMAPLMSDFEFQARSRHPSVKIFAPYATSRSHRSNPLLGVRPLIELLCHHWESEPGLRAERLIGVQHSTLVREALWADQDPVEPVCRLAARLLKSGARSGAPALLFTQGKVPNDTLEYAATHLQGLIKFAGIPPHLPAKRAALMLLVERADRAENFELAERLEVGVRHLFKLRGWRIRSDAGSHFEVETDNRRFGVRIDQRSKKDDGWHQGHWQEPGLSRAPLLVIHVNSRRDRLLEGNCGPYFHVAIEDIALADPQKPWVWTILNRQLFGRLGEPSSAALRLFAALIVEAIRYERIEFSPPSVQWDVVRDRLSGPDCLSLIRLVDKGTNQAGKTVAVRVESNNHSARSDLLIEVRIEAEGPVIRTTDFAEELIPT